METPETPNPEEPQEQPKPPQQAPVPRPRPGMGSMPKGRPLGSGAYKPLDSAAAPDNPEKTQEPKDAPEPKKDFKTQIAAAKPSSKLVMTNGIIIFLVALAYVSLVFVSRNSILVDGKTIHHYSFTKGTTRQLLAEYKIEAGEKDIVTPPLDKKVRWGEKVQLVRVTENFEKKSETVDFVLEWKNQTTKNLRKVEVQHGHREVKVWYVKHKFHDGKEVSSEDSTKIVNKTPVERLVLLDGRDYAQTTYDLSKCKKLVVTATAYWKGDKQVPGVVTYSGHKVERGLVAVDPKTIPLGWRLYIPEYGYAYSSDTGSKIKGNRIDLFVESKKASKKWEYNKVTVYLLEKAAKW